MAKCLVTKLNGSTDNDILKYIDAVVIQFKAVDVQTDKNSSIVIQSVDVNNPVKVECIKGNFTDSTYVTNNGVEENTTNARLNVSNGAIIKLSPKSNIAKISFDDGVGDDANKIIAFSDLKYCKALKQLLVSGDIQGAVELANKKSLTYLSITNSSIYATTEEIANVLNADATVLDLTRAAMVTGNIGVLGSAIGLQKAYLTYTEISGTVESLLENMWRNGRKSGKIVVTTGHNISFNGETHGDYGYTVTATFSESNVIAVAGSITRTFNGTDWENS